MTRCSGGCIFAENPVIAAPQARLVWHADLDPGTLVVEAVPATGPDPDAIDPAALGAWLTVVADSDGREHAVLSDGWHHIRLDIERGTLSSGPVILRYRLVGSVSARAKLLPLRRLVEFSLHRRFARSLFPPDPRIARWLTALQVHDGLAVGASLREIGDVLCGAARVAADWDGPSDSLRSRMRRLASEARRLAQGGWRALMRVADQGN
ncbi:DNA -binding domain-containing protein [Sphingomonas sp.]|uniref:DNA -binding domain-containing protein n=1 Tax=Sphingomonas sp. TaxID=28214 RepID=UPI003D6CFECA